LIDFVSQYLIHEKENHYCSKSRLEQVRSVPRNTTKLTRMEAYFLSIRNLPVNIQTRNAVQKQGGKVRLHSSHIDMLNEACAGWAMVGRVHVRGGRGSSHNFKRRYTLHSAFISMILDHLKKYMASTFQDLDVNPRLSLRTLTYQWAALNPACVPRLERHKRATSTMRAV
jgi:hypothetical protein